MINDGVAQRNAATARMPKLLTIYVAQHCEICAYSYEVADLIRREFPHVTVQIVDIETEPGELPEAVFATPTYLIDGRVWSLGNPSLAQVYETFSSGNGNGSK